jgi:hypothetical protein
MNRFDILRRPSISGGPLLPSIYAANHPRNSFDAFLIFAQCFGLVTAVSSSGEGSSQEVDGQWLTASSDTDKSRFLTFCYATETILDGGAILMQAPPSPSIATEKYRHLRIVIFRFVRMRNIRSAR